MTRGCGIVNARNWYFFSSYLLEVSLMPGDRPLNVNNSSTKKDTLCDYLTSFSEKYPMNHSEADPPQLVRQTEVLIMCIMIITVLNTYFKTWYLPNWKNKSILQNWKKIRIFQQACGHSVALS